MKHRKLRKILKEVLIPGCLTCLLRNLNVGHETTVRTGHGTMDWLQIGKGVHLGCILSRCLFNVKCWVEKLELELPGEISITSDMPISPP